MKKLIFCLAIAIVAIACLFSAGCIGVGNDSTNDNQGTSSTDNDVVTNKPKYSIKEIENFNTNDTVKKFKGTYDKSMGFTILPTEFSYYHIPADNSGTNYYVEIEPRGAKEYSINGNVITVSTYQSSYVVLDNTKASTAIWVWEYGEGLIGAVLYVDSSTYEDIKQEIIAMKAK